MRFASAAALLSVLVTAPASAVEPLQPTGKWTVDFGDAHCTAMRSYGPADKPVTLAFKAAPIGDIMHVSVVRRAGSGEVNQYPGTLTVDRAEPVAVSFVGHPGGEGKLRITSAKLPSATFAPVRTAASLRLRASGEIDSRFALSNMGEVASALDRCIVDLREVWNVGPHAEKLKQGAVPLQPLPRLFSKDDYPRVALASRNTGLVEVIMLINEAGRIAACEVSQTSGHASLDAQTCMILARRGRFSPAVGPDGKPAKSATTARIYWRI